MRPHAPSMQSRASCMPCSGVEARPTCAVTASLHVHSTSRPPELPYDSTVKLTGLRPCWQRSCPRPTAKSVSVSTIDSRCRTRVRRRLPSTPHLPGTSAAIDTCFAQAGRRTDMSGLKRRRARFWFPAATDPELTRGCACSHGRQGAQAPLRVLGCNRAIARH